MCPPNGMFKGWSLSSAVESARRIDFHLSMRYAEWPHRRVVTQKNTRWRSSSTEWDSSPTRRWAGRSHKRRPVCYVSSSGIGFQSFSLCRSAALICNRALTVSVGHSCSVNVGLIDCAQRGGAYPHTDAEGADVVPKEAGAAAHWGRVSGDYHPGTLTCLSVMSVACLWTRSCLSFNLRDALLEDTYSNCFLGKNIPQYSIHFSPWQSIWSF